MKYPFQYKNNILHCDQLNLRDFATETETPFYLYSQKEIEYNCKIVASYIEEYNLFPCYALKANFNPQLLKIIRQFGFGADIVSEGELLFAGKAGFKSTEIVFAGVGKSYRELELAVSKGVHSLNIESEAELLLLEKITEKLSKKIDISIRVNPDVNAKTHAYISTGMHQNKFGVSEETALKLYDRAAQSKWIDPVGVHVHIGSQITDKDPYLSTARFLCTFIEKLDKRGISIAHIDLGGGIGINYNDPFLNPDKPRSFLEEILPAYMAHLKPMGLKLVAELGRAIIASAGVLISKVMLNKKSPAKNFIIVDAAMTNLIRPSLYQAYHQIVPVVKNNNPEIKADIVGPVCESGDFLAKDRMIQQIAENDLIAIGSAGAYGQVLSSFYNLRPIIKEYLVNGSQVKNIFGGISVEDLAKKYTF